MKTIRRVQSWQLMVAGGCFFFLVGIVTLNVKAMLLQSPTHGGGTQPNAMYPLCDFVMKVSGTAAITLVIIGFVLHVRQKA